MDIAKKDWRWVCSLLQGGSGMNPVSLPLVDTLVFEGGRPSFALKTAPDGNLVAAYGPDLRDVYSTFLALNSSGEASAQESPAAAVVHYSAGLPLVLDTAAFGAQTAAGFLIATAVQPFIRSSQAAVDGASSGSCAVPHAGYRYEYNSEASRDELHYGPCWRYYTTGTAAAAALASDGEAGTVAASGRTSSVRLVPVAPDDVPSSDLARMASVTRQLVSYIELAGKMAVKKLAAEFTMDASGALWLVRTAEVQVAHSPSPAALAGSKLQPSAIEGSGLKLQPGFTQQPAVGGRDLNELKQLSSPTPGLLAVATALGHLVSGKPRTWERVKDMLRGPGLEETAHAMAQLQQDPCQVSLALLEALRPSLTGEALSDGGLRRTGALAERLGLWMRAVAEGALKSHGVRSFDELPLGFAVLAESVATGARRVQLLQSGVPSLADAKLSDGTSLAQLAAGQLPPDLRASVLPSNKPAAASKVKLEPTAVLTASLALGPSSVVVGGERSKAEAVAARSQALKQLYGRGSASTESYKTMRARYVAAIDVAGISSSRATTTTTGTEGASAQPSSKAPAAALPAKQTSPAIPGFILPPDVSVQSGTFRCADGIGSVRWALLKPAADVAASAAAAQAVTSRVDSGSGAPSGKPAAPQPKPTIVLVPNLFDSLSSSAALVSPLVQSGGVAALVLSLPGQAGTSFGRPDLDADVSCSTSSGRRASSSARRPQSPNRKQRPVLDPRALNNEYLASCLHQLLAHLDASGAFLTATNASGFSLVGVGRGGNVGLCWAARYGSQYAGGSSAGAGGGRGASTATAQLGGTVSTTTLKSAASAGSASSSRGGGGLRSMVLISSFAHVDPQLSYIAQTTRGIFRGYPADRADLADAYFQRFMVPASDAAAAVAASVPAADAVPEASPSSQQSQQLLLLLHGLSMEGRVALLHGLLHDTDLRPLLSTGHPLLSRLPLVLLRGGEDALVSASAHEALLASRDGSNSSVVALDASEAAAASGALPDAAALQLATDVRAGRPSTTILQVPSAGHDVLSAPSCRAALLQALSAVARPRTTLAALAAATSSSVSASAGDGPPPPTSSDVTTSLQLPLERAGPPSDTSSGCGGPSPDAVSSSSSSSGACDVNVGSGREGRPFDAARNTHNCIDSSVDCDCAAGGSGYDDDDDVSSFTPRPLGTLLILSQEDGLMEPPPPTVDPDEERRRAAFEAQFEQRLASTKVQHAAERGKEGRIRVSTLWDGAAVIRQRAIDAVSTARLRVTDALSASYSDAGWAERTTAKATAAIALRSLPFTDITPPAMDFAAQIADRGDGGIRTAQGDRPRRASLYESETGQLVRPPTWLKVRRHSNDVSGAVSAAADVTGAAGATDDGAASGANATAPAPLDPPVTFDSLKAAIKARTDATAAARAVVAAQRQEVRAAELARAKADAATDIQAVWRGYAARKLVTFLRIMILIRHAQHRVALGLQRAYRHIAGLRDRRAAWLRIHSARNIQRSTRRWLAYLHDLRRRQWEAALHFQRLWRGWRGRQVYKRMLAEEAHRLHTMSCATHIQRVWRGYAQRQAYEVMWVSSLAARQVQRVFRGWRVRKAVDRKEVLAAMSRVKRIQARMTDAAQLEATMARSRGALVGTLRALKRQQDELGVVRAQLTLSRHRLEEVDAELKERGRLVEMTEEQTARRAQKMTKRFRRIKLKTQPSLSQRLQELQASALSSDAAHLGRGLQKLLPSSSSFSGDALAAASPIVAVEPANAAADHVSSEQPPDALALAKKLDGERTRELMEERKGLLQTLDECKRRTARIDAEVERLQLERQRHLAGLDNLEDRTEALAADQAWDLARLKVNRPPAGPTLVDVQVRQEAVVQRALSRKNVALDHAAAMAGRQLQDKVLAAAVPLVATLAGLSSLKQLQVDKIIEAVGPTSGQKKLALLTNGAASTSATAAAAAAEPTAADRLLCDMAPDRPLGGRLSSNVRVDLHRIAASKLGFAMGRLGSRAHDRSNDASSSTTTASRPRTSSQRADPSSSSIAVGVSLPGLPENIHPNVRPMGLALQPTWAPLAANRFASGTSKQMTAPQPALGSMTATAALAIAHTATAEEEKRSFEATSATELAAAVAAAEAAKPLPRTTDIVFVPTTSSKKSSKLRPVDGAPHTRQHSNVPVLTVDGVLTVRDVLPDGSLPTTQQQRLKGGTMLAPASAMASLRSAAATGLTAPAADASSSSSATPRSRASSRRSSLSTPADDALRLLHLRSRAERRASQSSMAGGGRGELQEGALPRQLTASTSSALAARLDVALPADAGPAERAARGTAQAAAAAKAEGAFPSFVRRFTVDDVCRWLKSICLAQYTPLARDAGLDGELLLQLDVRDLKVLGIDDANHVRTIIGERENLRKEGSRNAPSAAASKLDTAVRAYYSTDAVSSRVFEVFAHARAGRLVKVEEALKSGLPVNVASPSTDVSGGSNYEEGSTLLMAAVAGGHRRVIDLLLARGADINARNREGLTALDILQHARLTDRNTGVTAIDADGTLTQYLRARGAVSLAEIQAAAKLRAQAASSAVPRARRGAGNSLSRAGARVVEERL